MRRLPTMLIVLAAASTVLAHGGEHHGPGSEPIGPRDWHELWTTWGWEPLSIASLAISAGLYAMGLRRVGPAMHGWEIGCFIGGWFALFIALVSPLHPWGSVLFSAHMTQHEVLMLVAAPLIVLGRPLIVMVAALPRGIAHDLGRLSNTDSWRSVWRLISGPFAAWLIHAVILWVWHAPPLFEATLHSEVVHALQHASFLGSALLFWWAVIHGGKRAVGYGAAVLYMFTTAMHSGLLGVLLTLATRVWYPAYQTTTQSWGLTPLEDQQLGGLIMWVPAGVVYLIAGLALFAEWLRESERRAQILLAEEVA
jgi:cytochrome c oxidase assembly factor CtaG